MNLKIITMKKIFTLSLLLSSLFVMAQPTINSNVFPSIGTTLTSNVFDATNVNQGPAGANQTWSFTGLMSLGTQSQTFVSPASTPYAASFPAADISLMFTAGTDAFYTYYDHTTSATELLGLGYSTSGTVVEFVYSNPQKQFQYPLTFGQQFSDVFTGSYSIVLSGINIVNYRSGTIYSDADAYGTITTPSGTFNNVLRVRTRQVTTDSSVYTGFPLPPTVQYSNITSFLWISNNPGNVALMQIAYDTLTDNQGTPPTYEKNGQYQITSVGINDVNLKAQAASIFPNPATDFTTVDVSVFDAGEAILQVYDASGRLVKNQNITIGTGETKTVMVHTEEFATGFYQMNLIQKDKLLQAKFLKQ